MLSIGVRDQGQGSEGVTLSMRAYHSTHQLWAARHFARRAQEMEEAHQGRSRFDPEHRGYVTGAIFFSVAFLEANVNELIEDLRDGYLPYFDGMPDESHERLQAAVKGTRTFDRLVITDKYQLILALSGLDALTPGERPFQDVALLIKLRNELMHHRSRWLSQRDPHKLAATLKGRFEPNRMMAGSGNAFFRSHALGAGCANWAVTSSEAFAEKVSGELGIRPNYTRVIDQI